MLPNPNFFSNMLKPWILNMLSSYVDNKNKDTSVAVSLLGGNIEMDRIKFNVDGLGHLLFGGEEGLPFRLDAGTARKLTVKIPVTSLGSRSVRIEMDGILLHVTLRDDAQEWNAEKCMEELRTTQANNIQEMFNKFLVKPLAETRLFAMYHDPSSTINRQLARVLDNIHIDCTDVCVLLSRASGGESVLKMTCAKLTTFSCDEAYQVESFDSVVDFITQRLIQVRGFTITGGDGSIIMHLMDCDIRTRINTEKEATHADALSRIDGRILFFTKVRIDVTNQQVRFFLLLLSVLNQHDEFRKRAETRLHRAQRAARQQHTHPDTLEAEYIALIEERIREGDEGKPASPHTEHRCKHLEHTYFLPQECIALMRRAYQNLHKIDPRTIFHTPLFTQVWTAEAVAQLGNSLLPAEPTRAVEDDAIVVVFDNPSQSYGLELINKEEQGEIMVESIVRGGQADLLRVIHPGMVIFAVNGVLLHKLTYQGKLRVLECANRPTMVTFVRSKVGAQWEMGVVVPSFSIQLRDYDDNLTLDAKGLCVHMASRFPAVKTMGVSLQSVVVDNVLCTMKGGGPLTCFQGDDDETIRRHMRMTTPPPPHAQQHGGLLRESVSFISRNLLTEATGRDEQQQEDYQPLRDTTWKELFPDTYGGSDSSSPVPEHIFPPLPTRDVSPPRWLHALHGIQRWLRNMHESPKMHALAGCVQLRESGPGFMLCFKRSRPKRSDDLEVIVGLVDVLLIPARLIWLQKWWDSVGNGAGGHGGVDFTQRLNPQSPLQLSILTEPGQDEPLPPRVVAEMTRLLVRVVAKRNDDGGRDLVCVALTSAQIMSVVAHAPPGVFSVGGECALISTWVEVAGERQVLLEMSLRVVKISKTTNANEPMPEMAVEVAIEPIILDMSVSKYMLVKLLLSRQEEVMNSFKVPPSSTATTTTTTTTTPHTRMKRLNNFPRNSDETDDDDFRSARGSILSSSSRSLAMMAGGSSGFGRSEDSTTTEVQLTRNRLKRLIEHALETVLHVPTESQLDFDAPIDLSREEMLAMLRELTQHVDLEKLERLSLDLPHLHMSYSSMINAMLWILLNEGGTTTTPNTSNTRATMQIGLEFDKVSVSALDAIYFEIETCFIGTSICASHVIANVRAQRALLRELQVPSSQLNSPTRSTSQHHPIRVLSRQDNKVHLSSKTSSSRNVQEWKSSFTVRKSTRSSLDKDMIVCFFNSDGLVAPSKPIRFVMDKYFKDVMWKAPLPPSSSSDEQTRVENNNNEGTKMKATATLTGVRVVATYAAKRVVEDLVRKVGGGGGGASS